jgi:pilus assembly protein CpaB
MARKRAPILIAASLLLGGAAAWLANGWIQARAVASPAKSTVVVAAMDIPFGTRIEARHLRSLDLPPGAEPPHSFREIKQVEGKVTTASLLAGEIVMAGRVVDSASGSALSAIVDQNMRAITVRVDDVVGVAGFLLPGNRVDVVAARKLGQNRAETETILHNLRVLAVDQTASTDKNEPVVVRAVTLEMTPEQAEILVRGRVEGTIQLTLRNPLDESMPVVAKAPEPRPEPMPKPVVRVQRVAAEKGPEIQLIRGTQVRELEASR